MNSYYTEEDLALMGFKSIGKNVLISKRASFYGRENISLGNNVRIDDFCILSGNIKIGNNVHIAAYCGLYGRFGIYMEDYTGLSIRCTLLSASDDFSGEYLVGPTIEPYKTNVTGGEITLRKHVIIGLHSVVLPNVHIGEGTVVGAMSLVNKNLKEWGVYFGVPVKRINERSKKLLRLINT